MHGNTGVILLVDLSLGEIRTERLPEEYYTSFIGGSGLAAKLFWEKGDFSADPLSPEAMLMFMNGPMAGLKISGASRGCVAGRSPLTGAWGDSSSGGYFAPELKYAGYDGIVITGRAVRPCLLLIEDEKVQLVDAGEYWGQGVGAVTRSLKKRYGEKHRVVTIGQAGENRVGYACIVNEIHHSFGRSGFGALMGAKALKAVVVKGSGRKVDLADPEKFDTLRRTLTEKTLGSDVTKAFRAYGTAFNLEGGMQIGDVPIRNWTSNLDEEMGRTLNGATLAETYLVKEKGCMFCAVNCKRQVAVPEGPFAVSEGVGPEYESIVSLGSLLGSSDLAAACKANRLCNEYGMDTISAGGTIAWAMEAFEKGHLKPEEFDGISLNWGDMACVTETILPKIAGREGRIGDLLADGSVAASKRTGPETRSYTVHSKGLEAPMHDPRGGGHGLALSYATSARGACHVADAMLFIEMGFSYFPEVNLEHKLEPMSDSHKAEYAVLAQELGAVKNSACWCVFADLTFTLTDWVDLFNTVPGYDWDAAAMMRAGRRIVYLKRLINHRYGMRAKDDALTPRMLEPARDGLPKGKEIKFEKMKSEYYRLFGIDPVEGIPGDAEMQACGMTEQV